MATKTRTVRYVGASLRGREIDGVGRVYPPGVKIPAAEQPADADTPVLVDAPNTADVDEEVALGLIRSPEWEPVGWSPDAPAAAEVLQPARRTGSTVRSRGPAPATALDQADADGAGDDPDGGDA